METNVTDCFISTVHKICVTNHTKGKFLSITRSGLRWTDNSNFASCFDSAQEVMEYTERQYVRVLSAMNRNNTSGRIRVRLFLNNK